jgi:hypothetical protein
MEQQIIAFDLDLEKSCRTGKDYFHNSVAHVLSLATGGTFQFKTRRLLVKRESEQAPEVPLERFIVGRL